MDRDDGIQAIVLTSEQHLELDVFDQFDNLAKQPTELRFHLRAVITGLAREFDQGLGIADS